MSTRVRISISTSFTIRIPLIAFALEISFFLWGEQEECHEHQQSQVEAEVERREALFHGFVQFLGLDLNLNLVRTCGLTLQRVCAAVAGLPLSHGNHLMILRMRQQLLGPIARTYRGLGDRLLCFVPWHLIC